MSSRGLGHVERSRIDALLDVQIADPVPPLTARGPLRRLWERVTTPARWKEIAHHLARLPVAVIGFALTMAAWGGSLAMVLLPVYVDELPGDSAKFYFFEVTAGAAALAGGRSSGSSGWCSSPRGSRSASPALELALARALLGPNADQVHAAQVTRLETSRTAAVDSAETERRRIERDLHDGAQQRLVALAANLGAAREKLDRDEVAEGRAMVAVAHEEAKAALREIRDLVRGIHPVILEDRGLDAALSAVVARSPIPVTLDVACRRAAAGGRRERGLLRRQRGADQRRPPRHGDAGPRRHRPGRRPARRSRCATTASAAPTSPRAPACRACATGSPGSAARCT